MAPGPRALDELARLPGRVLGQSEAMWVCGEGILPAVVAREVLGQKQNRP